jgi:hypothetical protein
MLEFSGGPQAHLQDHFSLLVCRAGLCCRHSGTFSSAFLCWLYGFWKSSTRGLKFAYQSYLHNLSLAVSMRCCRYSFLALLHLLLCVFDPGCVVRGSGCVGVASLPLRHISYVFYRSRSLDKRHQPIVVWLGCVSDAAALLVGLPASMAATPLYAIALFVSVCVQHGCSGLVSLGFRLGRLRSRLWVVVAAAGAWLRSCLDHGSWCVAGLPRQQPICSALLTFVPAPLVACSLGYMMCWLTDPASLQLVHWSFGLAALCCRPQVQGGAGQCWLLDH